MSPMMQLNFAVIIGTVLVITCSCLDYKTKDWHTKLSVVTHLQIESFAGMTITECTYVVIRGYLKERCLVDGKWYFKCPFSTHYYRVSRLQCKKQEFTSLCPDDGTFYQSCGHVPCPSSAGSQIGRGACGEALCETSYRNVHQEIIRYATNIGSMALLICDGKPDCSNTINGEAMDEAGCDIENSLFSCEACDSGVLHDTRPYFRVSRSLVCDKKCDCFNCFDEANCYTNYSLGVVCEFVPSVARVCDTGMLNYVEPSGICDGYRHCVNGLDEQGCAVSGETCRTKSFAFAGKHQGIRRLHEHNKCSIPTKRPLCTDWRDQMNCTNTLITPLTCEIEGYPTTISEYVVCKGYGLCDDRLDDQCVEFGENCMLHKHQLCDGVNDCSSQIDEENAECQKMTAEDTVCLRRFSYGERTGSIPVHWILDGHKDCEDGLDEEQGNWYRMCGTGDVTIFSFRKEVTCDKIIMLKCPQSTNHLRLDSVCTGFSNCDKLICSKSRRSHQSPNKIQFLALSRRIFHCFPGLEDLEYTLGQCTVIPLRKDTKIYGLKDSTIVLSSSFAQRVISCESIFGEFYVYLVCTEHYNRKLGSCVCPLTLIPHTSCRDTHSFRFFTVTDIGNLTVAFKKSDGSLEQDVFGCKNGQCIDYHKVCDLNQDCEDATDESNCSNNFRCFESGEYIAIGKKCDGVIDCLDYTDECNTDCDNQVKIFRTRSLFALAFFLGTAATTLNFCVIFRALRKFSSLKSAVAKINEAFVLVVSSGDLLQGIFILLVAVSDELINKSTCKTQLSWVTNDMCTALGIISTIGSLVSLYSMTILSLIRAMGLRKMNKPKEDLSLSDKMALIGGICCTYIIASIVAFIPTIGYMDSFFIQRVKYDDNPLFVSGLTKESHMEIIKAYYGRMTHAREISWNDINRLVQEMFINGHVVGDRIGFYGINGFCLFNYFVSVEDPQILFSGLVLLSNAICVGTIAICYISIHILTSNSIRLAGSNNQALVVRNRKLQRNISILILTDILSWVPFFVVWFIHIVKLLDTSKWHSLFSTVILPLNSIMNPVLILEDQITSIRDKIILQLTSLKGRMEFMLMGKVHCDVEIEMTTDQ